MEWTDVLICVYLIGAMVFFFQAGTLKSEMELISAELGEKKLQLEVKRQAALIERMKQSGRKRRKQLKEAREGIACARLFEHMLLDDMMSLLRRNDALRGALSAILFRVSRSRWEAKRYIGILKKYGVIRWQRWLT